MTPPTKPNTNVIKVPKTPMKAFNPKRPVGTLVQAQVALFEAALKTRQPAPPRSLKARARKPSRRAMAAAIPPKTEGHAAARVQELHAELLAHPAAVIPRAAPPAAPPPRKRRKVSR